MITQCGKYGKLLSHCFDKKIRESNIFTKLQKYWFHEIFSWFSHTLWNFSVTQTLLREIEFSTLSNFKIRAISRKICVANQFLNFVTVSCYSWKSKVWNLKCKSKSKSCVGRYCISNLENACLMNSLMNVIFD